MSDFRKEFFSDVFQKRKWESGESVSGHGSDTAATRTLVAALPAMFHRLSVRSLLDVPCGDFHWMRDVDLQGIDYTGGDIVPDLVARNQAGEAGRAVRGAISSQTICREVDMVFVRDCFIHFTNDLIFQALRNIQRSGSRYLCVTHEANIGRFGGPSGRNIELDRAVEGVNHEFRPISFELPPFAFGKPIDSAADRIQGNAVTVMAVWDIAALPLNDI